MYIWGRLRGIQWDSCRARLQHQRFMTVPPIRRSTRSNRVKDLGRWTRVEVWWVGSFWDFGSDQDTTGGQPLLDGDGDVQNAAWGGQALDPKNHSRPEHRDSSKICVADPHNGNKRTCILPTLLFVFCSCDLFLSSDSFTADAPQGTGYYFRARELCSNGAPLASGWGNTEAAGRVAGLSRLISAFGPENEKDSSNEKREVFSCVCCFPNPGIPPSCHCPRRKPSAPPLCQW